MHRSLMKWTVIKMGLFFFALTPFLLLLNDAFNDQLGANPIETLHFSLGGWAIRFLCIGLSLSPLRKLIGQSWPIRFRRMIGLFAFFYASLHFLVYICLDLSLSWEAFIHEVPKSPYILVGLLTYILLIPLALTSTKGMQKRLGKTWLKLHRLVYIAGIGAVIHFLWLVKSDYLEPLFYTLVMFILLVFRLLTMIKWPLIRLRFRT